MSSGYDSSLTATDTDTNLPSIPTINYPTPNPTPVSNPKDHGIGAPFYLAIVLASISFIGCVAAFVAWWIRSRTRKHDLEFDDPLRHRDTISDAGSPITNNAKEFEKRVKARAETQTRPYYLPASIVRRSSSNLLAVPHTVSALEDGTSRNGTSRAVPDTGRYLSAHRTDDPHSQNLRFEPNPYQNAPSSETTNLYPRPATARLQTGTSVQESTRTLGRLRVANRVPGDVTSGDEGGINVQNNAGVLPVADASGPDVAPVGENAVLDTHSDQNDRFVQKGDAPLEPPGPATLSWGRRTDTVAALRRTRRRAPETTIQTYKNAKYSGYWYPTPDGGPSTHRQASVVVNGEENERVPANPNLPFDPLGWKSTLKSSFWQAVDAMTGNRPPDLEPRAANAGGGSGFTPAPHRVASRRPPVSPARLATGPNLPDTRISESKGTESKYELTLSDESVATQETLQNSIHSIFSSSSTGKNGSGLSRISEDTTGRVGSLPPRMSHLNRDFGASTHRRYPEFLGTDTGSVYSTDSAAARANLRKYGYGSSIPSTWSALGAIRESQLDLDRVYLPLPRPMTSSSPSPLSITPSQLTLESGVLSGSVSTRTRTSMRSGSDLIGSGASTTRSGKDTASYGETTTSSMSSVSRTGTLQSGHSTIGHGTVPLHSSSTTSSMLSRKKGVTTRRKRPKPPPRASSASSVQSIESGLSIREVAVRRALLERRKKIKVADSLKGREDSLIRSRDANSLLVST